MGKSPKEDSNLLADEQQGLDLHLLTPRMSISCHTASLFTFKAIPQMIKHLSCAIPGTGWGEVYPDA